MRRWAGGALVTLVLPWAVGHWVWRPQWAPPMLSPHPEVLADQYWWIPEYVFGVSAVLALMLVAFLRRPRRSRSFLHWTVLVCAAAAPIWLAAPVQHLVEQYGRYKYEHSGISVSALHGSCVQTVRRWNRKQDGETFTWTVARSGDCGKVVVYRGWAQVWTRSARSKHVIGGTFGHYEGLVMVVEATKREGKRDRVMALDDTTGKKKWSYSCPKGRGPMESLTFVGSDGGQVGAPVKGRTRYVRVGCDGRTVLLAATAKKRVLKTIK